jgi:hypothetical protein
MSQPETENCPSLGTIITALHDSEINGAVSFFDDVWRVVLGTPSNGIDPEAIVGSPQEAAEWLRKRCQTLPAQRVCQIVPARSTSPDDQQTR